MSASGPFGRQEEGSSSSRPAPPGAREPPRPGPPRAPARASSFTWLLGVACVVGLAYITLNTVRTDAPGSRGVQTGRPLPPFAAPLASSRRRCDGGECHPNVAPRPGEGARRAACQVRLPDVLNSCALAERGPVALAFLATRSERCEEQVDVMESLRARFPDVQLAAVSVRGDRAALRRTIRERRWRLPVAHDSDGAVSNLYAVALCPTITFARAGGTVTATSLAFLDEAALARQLRAIGGRER